MAENTDFRQLAQKTEDGGTASYWQHPGYSMIVKVVQSAGGAISASIHTLNPADKNTQEIVQEVTADAPKSRFITMLTNANPNGLLELCGYSTDMNLRQTGTHKWSGEVNIQEAGRTIGLNVDMSNPNVMKLEAFDPSVPLFTKDTELQRVAKPPAACARP